MTHPFLDHETPLAFAHRGGAKLNPENSERAFRHAVDLGFTHIETDVQATADGVAVIMHDKTLDRTTNHSGEISKMTWAQIRAARIHGSERILTAMELLEMFPNTYINFDVKSDQAVEPLAQAVAAANALERVLISAFSDRRVDDARKILGDDLAFGAGRRRVAALWLRARRLQVPLTRMHAAQVPTNYGPLAITTASFVAHAHNLGIAVHVWGVDDAASMHQLLDLGVDGLMTDELEVLRKVFVDRGIWKN